MKFFERTFNAIKSSIYKNPRHSIAGTVGFVVFVTLLARVVVPILAAPPTSKYAPGETLNPTCAPGDINCTVTPPVSGNGTSTQITFWNGSSTITSDASLTYASSGGVLSVTVVSSTQQRTASSTIGTLTLANVLAVTSGGTGTSTLSDILGTAGQVSVSGGTGAVIGGNVTLSLPQSINTTSSPTFAGLTINGNANVFGIASSTEFRSPSSTISTLTVTSCTGCASPNGVTATGTVGYFPIFTATSTLSATSSLYWDSANLRVGLGTATPSSTLHIVGGKLRISTSTTPASKYLEMSFDGTNAVFTVPDPTTQGFTFAGHGAHSTQIGEIANFGAYGDYDIAIGNGANTGGGGGNSAIAIGRGAQAGSSFSEAIGYNSSVGVAGVTIGTSGSCASRYSITLGYGSSCTAANQFVAGNVGDGSDGIADVYFGRGVTAVSPIGFTLHGTGGSGTDIAAGDVIFSAGRGTGTGKGGDLRFETSASSTTGSSLNATSTRMIITDQGLVGIGTTSPSSTLHVNGSIGIGNALTYGTDTQLDVEGISYFSDTIGVGIRGSYANIGIYNNHGSVYSGISANQGYLLNSSGAHNGTIYNKGASWALGYDTTPVLTWNDTSGGQVGIGTTQPSSTLHVLGSFTQSSGTVSIATTTITGELRGASTTLGVLTVTSCTGCAGAAPVTTSSALTAGYFPYWATATGGLNGTSSIFQDATNSRVGIGTIVPNSTLDLGTNGILTVGPTSTLHSATALIDVNGTASELSLIGSTSSVNTRPGISLIRTRGTTAAPTAVVSGDAIGFFGFKGYDGSTAPLTGLVQGYIDGAVSTGVVPMAFDFITGTTAANRTARLNITSAGLIGIGIGTSTPSSTLHIAGNVTISSGGLQGLDGNGSDIAGGILTVSGGRGTGAGAGGSIQFNTAASSTTGSSLNATSTRMIITDQGLVGIGTSTPSSLFAVATSTNIFNVFTNGTIALRNVSYLFPTSQGGASTVLQNDGSGNLSWATASGGGSGNVITTAANVLAGYLPMWTTNASTTLSATSSVFWDSVNLRVGIGTAQPSSTLHVAGAALVRPTTATASAFSVQTPGSSNVLSVDTTTSTTNIFEVQSPTNVTYFGVSSSGLVAVGTSTPATLFTVGTSTNIFNVTAGGRVGINKSAPTAIFEVAATCTTFTTDGKCTDYAEIFPASEDVMPGELISIDIATTTGQEVRRSQNAYDEKILGIVSTNPAVVIEGNAVQLMNGADYHSNPRRPAVALAGRVPVIVSEENGAIKIGDFLTASSKPGVAMRATEPGIVVGMALENYATSTSPAATGTVMTFVNVHFSLGSLNDDGSIALSSSSIAAAASSSDSYGITGTTGVIGHFTAIVKDALSQLGLAIEHGVAHLKEIFADKVTTKQLCLDDVCVNKDQLKTLLNNNGISSGSNNSSGGGGGGGGGNSSTDNSSSTSDITDTSSTSTTDTTSSSTIDTIGDSTSTATSTDTTGDSASTTATTVDNVPPTSDTTETPPADAAPEDTIPSETN